jgi:hypothetical protein
MHVSYLCLADSKTWMSLIKLSLINLTSLQIYIPLENTEVYLNKIK